MNPNSYTGWCQPCEREHEERIKASKRRSYHRRRAQDRRGALRELFPGIGDDELDDLDEDTLAELLDLADEEQVEEPDDDEVISGTLPGDDHPWRRGGVRGS